MKARGLNNLKNIELLIYNPISSKGDQPKSV